MNMNLNKQLALMSDADAEICLNGILKGLITVQPLYAELLNSPGEMEKIVGMAAPGFKQSFSKLKEVITQEQPRAIRVLLIEMAEDPSLSVRLEAWLKTARPKLLEPVTSALVLAGIIMVLSAHINIEYENNDGKKHLKVKVEKNPTTSKILEKFFTFFK